MNKYELKGWVIILLLLFYSFGVATSIVSIAFDVSHMLQVGHVTLNELFDVFLQVTYVVLNGYIILIVHEDLFEKRECSNR